jgi:2,5-diamino-6-(ribosylamino)-4(3H)-pyrimidinone 5'-phosphate reductase
MEPQLYAPPPIYPLLSSSEQSQAQQPLTLSKDDQIKLKQYLPPPRLSFLTESSTEKQYGEGPATDLPHVTLTYAQSLDSQISLHPGQRTTLSGPETKAMTHWLRANHDAILIGAGTANADNPGLNTRYSEDGTEIVGLAYQPRPFILDPGRSWRQEKCEKLFELARQGLGRAPWWITSEDQPESEVDHAKIRTVKDAGGSFIQAGQYASSKDGVDWEKILRAMRATGVRSVMVEGGASVINDLLRKRNQHLISSIVITIAPTYLGSGGVVVAPPRSTTDQNEAFLHDTIWIPMGQDIVMAGVLRQE